MSKMPLQSRVCASLLPLLVLLMMAMATTPSWGIRVMTYNVLNYQSGRISQLQTVFNAIDADVIVLQEVDDLSAALTILSSVLNAPGGPGGYSFATFTTDGSLTNNALYFRSTVMTFTGSHIDVNTSPRETDRWRLNLVGYPGVTLYVYGMHLKAGSSGSDQADRLTATQLIRSNSNSLFPDSHIIFAGDYNIRASSESSYQQLIGSQADNTGRGFDPINSPGTWHNNSAFAVIHTQSPHNNNAGAPGGAAGGGIDDRFDFLLVSSALNDTDGFSYVPGTYRTFGNDGLHFNDDINDSPTIPEGAAVANALHGASDHLPVIADFQVPAKITHDTTLVLGTVLVGAPTSGTLAVSNSGDLGTFGFVDGLSYSLSGSAGVTVPAGTFNDAAGGGGNSHTVSMSTAVAGSLSGQVTINSNVGTQQVPVTGSVLRHAVPSLDPATQTTTGPLDFGTHGAGGFSSESFSIYNLGYDFLQGPLNVWAVNIIGPDAARFSIDGGFSASLVTGLPQSYSVTFDDSGPDGSYSAIMIFATRDDPSLAGGVGLGNVTVNLSATKSSGGCPTPFIRGEVNDDGIVNIGDPVYLLAFLFSMGPAPVPFAESDANGDGSTDVADTVYLLTFLFGSGPQPPAPFPVFGCP